MYRIEIETENAAFADGNEGLEVGQILRRIARTCEGAGFAVEIPKLMDVNGNQVGRAVGVKEGAE